MKVCMCTCVCAGAPCDGPQNDQQSDTCTHVHACVQRSGHPSEIAPAYVFLASADGSFLSGQVLHPNGGTVLNG